MSGIAGLYYRDGRPVEPAALDSMGASIAHRGPDGGGTWHAHSVGLGHRMLWTTPESLREELPFVNSTQELVITADARIDNRDELLSLLCMNDRPHGETSDSELLLAAYEMWGERCIEKLLGDFAFAIWDARKRTLFCARDHFGVKSFYYYLSDASFVFASEIKAVLHIGEVPRKLNETRIADYLAGILEDTTITFYQDIVRLPPAHTITVSPNGVQFRQYWALDPTRELQLSSNSEYAEAFRSLFFDAVRCRLRSAFPVGSTLSGGLDSSSIACTARHLFAEHGEQVHTFSAIFPDLPEHDLKKIDERAYIEAVLQPGGFVPHFVHADRLSPLAEYDKVLWHIDEPFLAPNLYMHWAMYGAAQREGVRVFLDGIDGDTTVSYGHAYLSELARKGQWVRLARESRAVSRVSHPLHSPRQIMWRYGLRPLISRISEEALGRLPRYRRHDRAGIGILNPNFAQRIRYAERTQMLEQRSTAREWTARAAHYNSLSSGMLPYTLEIADKAAAAWGLEPRYPFCDRRLIEFCLAIPPEQKLYRGWTRAILRRSMSDVLPPQVQRRISKGNLSPNFYRNFVGREKRVIEAIIGDKAAPIGEYVDAAALCAAYHQHLDEPSHQSPALTVYAATNLAIWLKNTGLGSHEALGGVKSKAD